MAESVITYLPGDHPEMMLLIHCSITQDNGALGLLGIVKYFSNLTVDCRHYMPGMEDAHAAPDWFD